MKKLLILGIIALFFGLAFIPSFNALSISKEIEETNTVVDDIEEDCDCNIPNGKLHLAEKLLTRLEKDEVLSNVIDLNVPPWEERPICILLNKTGSHYVELAEKYIDLADCYPINSLLFYLYFSLGVTYGAIVISIAYIGTFLMCWGW